MCIEGHVRKWNSLLQALTLLDELKSQGSGRESRRREVFVTWIPIDMHSLVLLLPKWFVGVACEQARISNTTTAVEPACFKSASKVRASLFKDPSHAHFVRQHESRELSRPWRRLPHSSLCAFIIMKPKVLFFHLFIFTGILEISNQGSRKKVFKRLISLLLCLYNGCR